MSNYEDLGIHEVFEGKCILVTGGTGFLGKVLLEKLLRSLPGIQKIFVVVRSARNSTYEDKVSELLQHKIFDRLRHENPAALKKIHPLLGDIILENFGLDESQLHEIKKEVSFIFHCAANVQFDDKPKRTLSINLLGVKHVLDICCDIPHLQAFVHVSTAFSFCNNSVIDEKIYPELVRPEKIIDALGWMTNEQLKVFCAIFLQGRPSLYHFSKALAEILVTEVNPPLPAIIVRPSIVTASVKEPYPGWIDNIYGPSGFISACGKGVVRTLLVNPDVNADWVPVDIVANTLIIAAYYAAVRRRFPSAVAQLNIPSRIPIINCTCPEENLITWMQVVDICLPFLVEYPSKEVFAVPGGTVTPSVLRYNMCLFTSHYIPALLIDFMFIVTGKKPRTVGHYKRIHKVMGHLELYTTNKFVFLSYNMMKLVDQVQPRCKEFPIDQRSLDWKEYIEDYVLGVRRYLHLEEDSTLPDARKKMNRIHYGWLAVKVLSATGVLLLLRKYTNLRLPEASTLKKVYPAAIEFIQSNKQRLFR